jgi:uncharacterized membrane protein YheB (UPF0754 family)
MKYYIDKNSELYYRKSYLLKKSGGKRIIYAPSRSLKHYQRKFIRTLNLVFLTARSYYVGNKDCVHGFVKNRSVITCASKHIGYETTLSFDVKSYFDNITYEMINDVLNEANIELSINRDFHFVERSDEHFTLAQGYASSPLLASIYSLKIVKELTRELSKILKEEDYVVTMYADDISISTRLHRDYKIEDKIKEIVEEVLNQNKLEINKKKTRVLRASNGNRRLLGIMVGKNDLFPTQKTKRRLRACKHYVNKYEEFEDIVKGLTEWSKLKIGKVDKNFIRVK